MVLPHRKIINKQRPHSGENGISEIFGVLSQEKQAGQRTITA